ncbi:hypothetical protein KCP91_12645 [Microvirga sp. SRT01]|jgi:hypothetical protein|uniref:Uncharacterized protein n=1 Tax=Sphingomonas longa TaxID=2778730 RepID=A0ABS2D8G7_9SPHN|nr:MULTISPECIES: hypothetical protein [Alphaproteobacteria]MBM6577224.1 hypothetical protein [Sphingomonas sp. BT552]MBR7710268.1 hypothetical protein [Microvirga sp. SRT01]
MTETVISPSGPGAIETGLMIDETGTRFVVLTFKEPGADPVLVTFTVPIFENFYRHLGRTAEAAVDEESWRVPD